MMEDEEDYGVFQNGELLFVCGGKEKAEEMAKKYEGGEAFPVEEVNRKFVKKGSN